MNGSRIATGPISQYLGPQYAKNVPRYPYDVQKANQLLDEAGLRRSAGGIRFRTRFTYDGTSAEFSRIADILKEMLAEVGIDMTLESYDFNTWFDRVYVKKDYEISRGRHITGPDAIGAMKIEFYSKNTGPGQRNYYFYNNPEVDRLIDQGMIETDQTRRLQIAHQLQVLFQMFGLGHPHCRRCDRKAQAVTQAGVIAKCLVLVLCHGELH